MKKYSRARRRDSSSDRKSRTERQQEQVSHHSRHDDQPETQQDTASTSLDRTRTDYQSEQLFSTEDDLRFQCATTPVEQEEDFDDGGNTLSSQLDSEAERYLQEPTQPFARRVPPSSAAQADLPDIQPYDEAVAGTSVTS